MKVSLQEILARNDSLGARPFSYDVYSHPEHDPGVLLRGHLLLQPLRQEYAHAVVVFDRDGCGSARPAAELSAAVQGNMDRSGWAGRSAVTVLDPELEVWVWAGSPHVAKALGWKRPETLTRWLKDKGHLSEGAAKPINPKSAMGAALQRGTRGLPVAVTLRFSAFKRRSVDGFRGREHRAADRSFALRERWCLWVFIDGGPAST